MKNYRVITVRKDLNLIREERTGFIVKVVSNTNMAVSLCKRLNGGQGFNGLTPRFFIDKRKQI